MRAVLLTVSLLMAAPVAANPLDGVERWFAAFAITQDEAAIARLAASETDMLVLDAPATLKGADAGAHRDAVARMTAKPGGGRRLVIAYLNVAQAEDYRAYWQDGWRTAPPPFLLDADPEGWAGNFAVAYWDPAWRAILFAEGGPIARIAADGYDGLYLDWVGGHGFPPIIDAARAAGIDPQTAMRALVRDVAAAFRARVPGGIVIAQNPGALVGDGTFLAVLDAIAQEHVWFDGAIGNDPPAGCRMPRSDAEADDPGYEQALTPGCARAFRDGRLETARYAQESWVEATLLPAARASGVRVLALEYATDPAQIAEARARARALGIVPAFATRPLDRLP